VTTGVSGSGGGVVWLMKAKARVGDQLMDAAE
jgi:hypothetical protein